MSEFTRFQAHERLMSRMADAQGADLDRAMQFGELSPEDYTDAVLACTGCSDPAGCRTHLQQERAGIPGFCRNRGMIERIAANVTATD